MKDGPVLSYCKDGIIYPVALDPEQYQIFETTCRVLFSPITIIKDKPQGLAVNQLKVKKDK